MKELSPLMQAKVGFKLVMSAFWGSSKIWLDSDPMWYIISCSILFLVEIGCQYKICRGRNEVGFGLFIVVQNLYLSSWLIQLDANDKPLNLSGQGFHLVAIFVAHEVQVRVKASKGL